ncbi:MAG TPA: YihY/virulence factor BrkB family protein [Pilimelia sp.]|nr:YihY/virulence factor BrkB family protein [Pilimelia sp.]
MRQLNWSTWRGVLTRAVTGFVDDNCGDWAAALTYYGVLALFPSAIVIVALARLVSRDTAAFDAIMDIVRDLLPRDAVNSLEEPLRAVVTKQSAGKVLLSFGLIGAVWSASGYIGAFTRASNAIYGVREGRPFYLLRPIQLGLSAIALVLMACVAGALVVSGPVAEAVGSSLGVGDSLITAWTVGKWPVLVLIIATLLTLLYWVAPNVEQPRFRWLTVGGALALVVWLLGSLGFALYVANFGSYDKTYGSLAAVIVFLVWLYLSNCAVMLGVEVNAELQRGRQLQAGAEDVDPPLPPKKAAT